MAEKAEENGIDQSILPHDGSDALKQLVPECMDLVPLVESCVASIDTNLTKLFSDECRSRLARKLKREKCNM